MKGVILSRNPAAQIVDITHKIAAQNILSAAYVLFGAYDNFPAGTIHLVVVDPGVGSTRQPIAAKVGAHFFVAPDNGVLSFVLRRARDYEAFSITSSFRENISNTFHGRDVFAPAAAALSLGIPLQEIGEQLSSVQLLPEPVCISSSLVESRIVHIDHFGNCVTGIERSALPAGALPESFMLEAGNHQIRKLRRFYLEDTTEPNSSFVIWGSIGFLEISLVSSSAAKELGLKIGDPVRLRFK